MRVLVTGGAGFIGGNLSVGLAERNPTWQVVAFDNLWRRGSELNLPRLRAAGVEFRHGDVRNLSDLGAVGDIQALVECSAEPSVLAGLAGSPGYLVETNLGGAYNCVEFARQHAAQLVFLSTSRVYPVAALRSLALVETETRFELAAEQSVAGASLAGIGEDFPLHGPRTLYGATKLAAELLIAEYVESFGLRAVIDRCGVVAGPWQMGTVDQGVFTYWLLCHYFGRSLEYIGFGGTGKQVRDLLHVADLVDLIEDQLRRPDSWTGQTINVGGGPSCSLSLVEATVLCRELVGRTVEIGVQGSDRAGDVPLYISDCRRLFEHTDWQAKRDARAILADVFRWVQANQRVVASALNFD